MTWILVNVPLMVVFAALWIGIPVWLVRRHPDAGPAVTAIPATSNPVRRVEPSRAEAGYRRVA